MRHLIYIFLVCFAVYGITNYGGIRAPDSEVVFRVAETIIDSMSFSPRELEAWPGFGVSPGKGGKSYSVYPPMESVVLVPAVIAARWINQSGWHDSIRPPVSHFYGRSLYSVFFREPLSYPEAHALRYLVSLADVGISAITVTVLYGILFLLSGSRPASTVLSLFYAFGTIAWPYAGSFFSEPLAVLFVLLSFYGLMKKDLVFQVKDRSGRLSFFLSGILLGLAAATHYTAMLFAPFWFIYVYRIQAGLRRSGSPGSFPMISWLTGFGVILFLLGYFNFIRFGDFFQSGRELSAFNRAEFVPLFSRSFWRNLFGLTAGSGKGLLFYVPAALIAVFAWRTFHVRHRFLFYLLIIMIATRVVFAAHYKDWHGGYSLGPRYLYMLIPFMILPAVLWFKGILEYRQWKSILAAGAVMYACVIQQLYFALGEVFSYYHGLNFHYQSKGVDIFANDRIYLSWNLSPLTNLHDNFRGPWLLQSVDVSNLSLWVISSAIVLIIFVSTALWTRNKRHSPLNIKR